MYNCHIIPYEMYMTHTKYIVIDVDNKKKINKLRDMCK